MKYYRVIPYGKVNYIGSGDAYFSIEDIIKYTGKKPQRYYKEGCVIKCNYTEYKPDNIYTYYINKKGQRVSTQLIPYELYTKKELIKAGLIQHINTFFKPVEISKNNIYWFFGARFECNQDTNIIKINRIYSDIFDSYNLRDF